ncbi:MAG TPA: efflux RND transporter periplasmic adaptor subunit [Pyrinomonadaceae bacterium]
MFEPGTHRRVLTLSFVIAFLCVACTRTASPPANSTNAQTAAPSSTANQSIETETVTPQTITGTIIATGKILAAEDRTAVIGPVNSGRIVRLYAGQGSHVKKGQKLADLESSDIDQAESDYLKALADAENARRTGAAEIKLAQETYDRTKMLYEKTIVPGKNLQAADHDLEVAKAAAASSLASTKAALTAARRRLQILGMSSADIDALSTKQDLGAVFSLKSPIDGIVVERNATIGATVGTDASLFKIIDISRIWVDASVFEKDLERVRNGQEVKLSVTAFPGSTFSGRVILISTVVDPESRTVKVRTEVPNADGRLKPDMFANVQIVTDQNRAAISIPQAAVLDDGGKSVVFVAENGEYKKRQVTEGIKGNDRVEIIDGLKSGDKVVIKGNYLLLQQSKGT